MRKVLMLVRAMSFNQEMEKPAQPKKNRMYRWFGVLAVTCIIVPCCVIVGFLTYLMTSALVEAGGSEQGLLFIAHFMALFAMLFGFQVVMSTFYFSSDLEHLLPLPLRTSEIISAKFLQTYLAESMMEFAILFSAFIGYFVAEKPSVIGVIAALLATFTLPLMPLLYCGIISLLLMYLTRWIRSSKDVSILIWSLTGVLFVFIAWAVGGLDGLMVENFVTGMIEGQNRFMNMMNVLFFHDRLLTSAIAHKNILQLGLYILLNAAVTGLFFALAAKLYLPGVHRMASTGNKKRGVSGSALLRACRQQKVEISYFKKEIKVLVRTGSYVTNCIMMTYVWPIATACILIWKGGGETLLKYRSLYAEQKGGVDILFLIGILLLALLIPGANAVASTSFTREGAHLDFMKYIPLSFEKQIRVKGAVSILMGYSSSFLCVLMLCAYFRAGLWKTVYMLAVSFLCCVLVTDLGVWLDSVHPKLVWENESAAMRGNLNVFFHMAFSIIAGGLLCVLAYVMYVPSETGSLVMHLFFLLLLLLLSYVGSRFFTKRAAANLENIL